MAKMSDFKIERNFVTKDEKESLVSNKTTFFITDVRFDNNPDNEYGDRWLLSLQVQGIAEIKTLSMSSNDVRDEQFESMASSIKAEPVGPCILIKGKSKRGATFYDIEDAE